MTENINIPCAFEIEKTILGLLLLDTINRQKLLCNIEEKDFYDEKNALIFRYILEMFNNNNEIDIQILIQNLSNNIEKVGGVQYVVNLTNNISITTDIDDYIKIIKEVRQRREIFLCGIKFQKIAQDSSLDSSKILLDSSNALRESVVMNINDKSVISPSNIQELGYNAYIDFINRQRLVTGYSNLDRITSFGRKEFSLIVARPGHSKSSLKSNIIHKMCENGYGVISVATEQTLEKELVRHVGIMDNYSVVDLLRPDTSEIKIQSIEAYQRTVNYIKDKWNFHIIADRSLDTARLRQLSSQIMMSSDKDIMFVDLFDKLTDVNTVDDKVYNVSVKLAEVNRLAEELNIHICLLAQLSRKVEERREKRPMMSDIKGSGAYEEMARLIIGLYRDRLYNPETLDDIVEAIIIKQNDGAWGSDIKANFFFDSSTLILDCME
jgi:replicative DNA helicase